MGQDLLQPDKRLQAQTQTQAKVMAVFVAMAVAAVVVAVMEIVAVLTTAAQGRCGGRQLVGCSDTFEKPIPHHR